MKTNVRACLGLFQRFQTLKRIRQPRPRRAADADIDADGRQTNEFDSESFTAVIGRHPSSSSARRGRARRRPRIPPPAHDREPPIAYHAIRPSRPRRSTHRTAATRAVKKRYVMHRTVHACARRRSRRVVVVHTYPLFLHETCVVERRTRRWNARA